MQKNRKPQTTKSRIASIQREIAYLFNGQYQGKIVSPEKSSELLAIKRRQLISCLNSFKIDNAEAVADGLINECAKK